MPDNSGAVDLNNLRDEEREALEELRKEGAPKTPDGGEVREALTAFIIIANLDGSVEVLAFQDQDLKTQVHPNGDLIIAAAQKVIRDLQVEQQAHANAQMTLVAMQQQMAAVQQQAQAAQIAKQVQAERRG